MFEHNYQQIGDKIILFITETVSAAGKRQVVVGLSGGVDSAVSATLAVRALGPDRVIPVLLPCGDINPQAVQNTHEMIETLAIPKNNVMTVDIHPVADAIITHDSQMDQLRRGNIMARTRMIYLYDFAKKHEALVVGTENRSEHLLGYFTRHGDGASDFEPIIHLYKTQVYGLARYLGLPEAIITARPTAGLWEGQTDEDELGFSYIQADQVLHLSEDRQMPYQEIAAKTGIDAAIVEKILSHVEANRFKRIPVPSLL